MDKMAIQSSTLFLGDLSMYCTEKDIFMLFDRFGPIESIILKKNNQHCYGFLCFQDPRSAEIGLRTMNGTVLHGRKIR
jgi:RNA recognition motif-containing protein